MRHGLKLIVGVLLACAALPWGSAAAADKATFKVSLYGIQRFHETKTIAPPEDPNPCFAEKGTLEDRTIVRFSTKQPALATVYRRPGNDMDIVWHDKTSDLLAKAEFAAGGERDLQYHGCDNEGWKPVPPPEVGQCNETLWRDFSLSVVNGELHAGATEGLVPEPPRDLFEGCPWGELTGQLYSTKQDFKVAHLMDAREMEIVLRYRDRHASNSGGTTTRTLRRSTVYATFKRVGR